MKTLNHDKDAGEGYQPGSPLYSKQQSLRRQHGDAATSAGSAAPTGHVKPLTSQDKRALLWFIIEHVLFVLLFAALYRRCKPPPRDLFQLKAPSGNEHFTYGFCDCHCSEDWAICLFAACCPLIRWADTVNGNTRFQLLPYWAAILMWLSIEVGLLLLGVFVHGAEFVTPLAVIFALIGIYYRQKLRAVFGHDPYTARTVCLDTMAWCCCPCCAIVQEAREVENCQELYIN